MAKKINLAVNIAGLLSGAALEAESIALAGAVKDMDGRVQLYLVSEIVHIEEHRNATRLNRFFSAIKGSSLRVSAMHAFIQTFANVRIDKKPKKHEAANGQAAWVETYVMRPIRDKWAFYNSIGKTKGMVHVKTFQELIDNANKDGGFLKFRPEPEVRDFVVKDNFASYLKNFVTKISGKFGENVPDDVAAAMVHLDKAAIAMGLKGSDITPANITIPEKVTKALHLVVDNTKTTGTAPEVKEEAPAAKRGRKQA